MMPRAYFQKNLNLRNVSAFFLLSAFFAPTFAETPLWQGPYMGVYVGGGFANIQASTGTGAITNTSYFATPANGSAVNGSGSWTQHPSSAIAGIQVGHDWVLKRFVYGVVTDYSATPLRSSKSLNNIAYPDVDTYAIDTSVNLNWLFTLRGRLGYQQNIIRWPSFVYATAGMALSQFNVSNHFGDTSSFAGTGSGSSAGNQVGWTAGGGVAFAVFPKMSVNVEYLYVHWPPLRTTNTISNTQAGFGIPEESLNSPFSTIGRISANLIKIGLNYRFDEAS